MEEAKKIEAKLEKLKIIRRVTDTIEKSIITNRISR